MLGKMASAFQDIKQRVDISSRVESTKIFAAEKFESGKGFANAAWGKHGPMIERVLVEGLLSIAEEKLQDEKMLEGVFLKIYETLPLAARFVFSRERFLEITMSHREPLLLKLEDVRNQRSSLASKKLAAEGSSEKGS